MESWQSGVMAGGFALVFATVMDNADHQQVPDTPAAAALPASALPAHASAPYVKFNSPQLPIRLITVM
ncbi:hypothetical protein N7532_011145 [Penicillium argentinense]|uniref:Uncharacterized protein n=1 Tax=Penicillium argentinense TaxID=1131581 RepID=A0A9W9EI03_9EURO|nr:uncharacterized protein N7532_011145 [Penicillium argentinense]KAJ5082102.1 hypothetical protein N7532_011145 [Penicillium argentinense]